MVGRGLSPVAFVGDFMASNRCLVIISAAIPQSSSARGSSKPMPYGFEIGFGENNKFCGKMLRAQSCFALFKYLPR